MRRLNRRISLRIISIALEINAEMLLIIFLGFEIANILAAPLTLNPSTTYLGNDGRFTSLANSDTFDYLYAVDYMAYVYRSTDIGLSWSVLLGSGNQWSGLACSSDGSRVYAGEDNNFGGYIYTSSDHGMTWGQTGAPTKKWVSVATSGSGSIVVGGTFDPSGNPDKLYVSTDTGSTWSPRAYALEWWRATAVSRDASLLVAGGDIIMTSRDQGVNWITRSYSGCVSLAVSANGAVIAAGTPSGTILISRDSGISWSSQLATASQWSVAVSADGSFILAAAYSTLLYASTNSGYDWISAGNTGNWYSVACSASTYLVVAGFEVGYAYYGQYIIPTAAPSVAPSYRPSVAPAYPSLFPSSTPSVLPTKAPSSPTITPSMPTPKPSVSANDYIPYAASEDSPHALFILSFALPVGVVLSLIVVRTLLICRRQRAARLLTPEPMYYDEDRDAATAEGDGATGCYSSSATIFVFKR